MHAHDDHAGHSHGIGHSHGFSREANTRRMLIAFTINVVMVVLSVVGAVVTGSLSLLADAGHVFSDVLAIALGVAAAKVATRPSSAQGTFGFGRVEILAALINGLALIVVAVFVAVEAIGRFSDPPHVSGGGVLIFGGFGLLGNALATYVLVRGDREDINLEAILRHSVADALGSFGVVLAGIGILTTGWEPLDPIVGLAIALLIVASSWRLISEPIGVLLERAPAGLDAEEIGLAIARVGGVREVHDLHVWSITSGFPALAAHVTVKATHNTDDVRRAIEAMLTAAYKLDHTTLQVSCEELLQIQPLDAINGAD